MREVFLAIQQRSHSKGKLLEIVYLEESCQMLRLATLSTCSDTVLRKLRFCFGLDKKDVKVRSFICFAEAFEAR